MEKGTVARDRLQPALFDRLIDLNPDEKAVEAPDLRLINKARLRQVVLRDLNALLNAARGLNAAEERRYPQVASSSLNFGLESLTGRLASGLDVHDVEQMLRRAILRFEPRLLPDSVNVKAQLSEDDLNHHNVIGFQIAGRLWAEPYPMELLLRTEVDLESGEARVTELVRTAQSESSLGERRE